MNHDNEIINNKLNDKLLYTKYDWTDWNESILVVYIYNVILKHNYTLILPTIGLLIFMHRYYMINTYECWINFSQKHRIHEY